MLFAVQTLYLQIYLFMEIFPINNYAYAMNIHTIYELIYSEVRNNMKQTL